MRRRDSSSQIPPDSQQQRGDWGTIKTLLPYFWAYKWRVILALTLLVGAKLANIGVPVVLKHIVDSLTLAPGNPAAVMVLPVSLLLAYGALRLSTTAFATMVGPALNSTIAPWAQTATIVGSASCIPHRRPDIRRSRRCQPERSSLEAFPWCASPSPSPGGM